MNLSDGAAATATGNANAFTLYNDATLGFSGSDDDLHVSGTGDRVSGSSGAIDLWSNAAATVAGDDDDLTLYDNTRLALSGSNDVVVLAGSGNQVSASSTEIELSGGSDAVTGSYDTIRFYGPATVAASGTHETFAMAATPANATISGFDATDTVQFSASTFANFNALLAHASQQGANTVIKTDATHSVVLSNTALSSLIQSRFTFA